MPCLPGLVLHSPLSILLPVICIGIHDVSFEGAECLWLDEDGK